MLHDKSPLIPKEMVFTAASREAEAELIDLATKYGLQVIKEVNSGEITILFKDIYDCMSFFCRAIALKGVREEKAA